MPPDRRARSPDGVKPFVLWIEDRLLDLSRAINEYLADGQDGETVYEWIKELKTLFKMRKEFRARGEHWDI